ncbi:MAG TPA: hypothetical protein VG917_05010 [Patescibacteria group bacterium]|nr:hypothetical protein [Patescibacteria group bacterium]
MANKIGWQKVAVIGIIAAILLIVFVVYLFISSTSSNKTSNKNSPSGSQNGSANGGANNSDNQKDQGTDQFGHNVITPTPLPTGIDFGSTVVVLTPYSKSKNYAISYPSTWKTNEIPVVGGGTITHFAFPSANGSEGFPRVDIQAVPITNNSTSSQQAMTNLTFLNLKRDTVDFHGVNADRLGGELPFLFQSGNPPVNKKVNKTFLFFDNAGYRYIVDYAYYVDDNQGTSLDAINSALSTFKFK